MAELYNKVKTITVYDGITLGTTEVNTQAVADRVIVDTYLASTLNFVCKYTSGTTKSPSPSISPSVSPSISPPNSVSPSISLSVSPSVSPSISASPSAIASSCIIKVWGYVGKFSSTNNFPYAATSNSEIAVDMDNWIQLGEYSISNGTATFTPTEFQIDADAAETVYDAHFSVDICWPKIRFSAYSSVSFQQQGTLDLVALIQ